MNRYFVTVSQPNGMNCDKDNFTVLATSSEMARKIALNLFRKKFNIHSSVQLHAETPIEFASNPAAAAFKV